MTQTTSLYDVARGVRQKAAYIAWVNKLSDDGFVDPLIQMASPPNDRALRSDAIKALACFPAQKVKGFLRGVVLSDQTCAEDALQAYFGGILDDKSAFVVELMGVLRDRSSPSSRRANVSVALARYHTPAVRAAFKAAADRGDLVIVGAAHSYFVNEGEPETIPTLVQALQERGTESMAVSLLNSGHPTLEEAARSWAARNHYTIAKSANFSSSDRWGSSRR